VIHHGGLRNFRAQQTFFEWISQEIASPTPAMVWHVSRFVIDRPPRGQFFTLLVAKAHFSQSNIVAFLGGSTPKRWQNFTFTVSMVSPE
jgi:hypothetical protein